MNDFTNIRYETVEEARSQPEPAGVRVRQHVAYFDDGEFHWMSGVAPRNCELYADYLGSAIDHAPVDSDADDMIDQLNVLCEDFGCVPGTDRLQWLHEQLSRLSALTEQQGEAVGIVGFDDVTDGLRVTLYAGAAVSEGDELYASPSNQEPVANPLNGKYGDVLTPFVQMMERELHANSGKGDRLGWLEMDRKTALLEIFYHLAKLQKAAKDDDQDGIREYGADVANMAMMLVDICGALATSALSQTQGE